MTETHLQPPARRRHGTLWIAAATLIALIASIAPWGTLGRFIVAVTFTIAVVTLAHQHGRPEHRGWTVGAGVVYVVVAWLHVVLTSPSVAWAVDGHMMPWLPLPGATFRIILAWSCTLGWAVLVAAAAGQIPRLRTRPAAMMLLGLTAALPLFNPDAFPDDGYELLWNRSTYTHPTYSIALLALLASAALLHPHSSRRDDSRHPPQRSPSTSRAEPR